MTFQERVRYKKAILVFKSLTDDISTPYLKDILKYNHDIKNVNLRSLDSKLELHIPKPRLEFCRKSFAYSGSKIWNSLPIDIRKSATLQEFKSKYIANWKNSQL